MKLVLRLIAMLSVFCFLNVQGQAQSSSGTISGHVIDSTGGVVVNADVQLINQNTSVVINTKVLSSGDFIFADVQPGTFVVVVKMAGFKELRKEGLRLSSSERLSAGTMVLQVGTVSDSVVVSAANTAVQTSSAEVSGLLDDKQLNNLLVVGRDFMGMLRTIPGVVGGGGSGSLGTSGTPNINGGRNVMNSTNVDGVSGSPRGGDKIDSNVNLDAIQEVKVLTSNYQAEYGAGSSGPVINVVTKGGTSQFHGAAYYYGRNEAFNANDWFNNNTGVARPRYRYNTIGGNIGGPVFWPGRFNTNKNKLFFFYSQEYWPSKQPYGLKKYWVPTALERTGDFSQTYQQGTVGATNLPFLLKVPGQATSSCIQPSAGKPNGGSGCITGNKLSNIPSAAKQAIDPQMQALVNTIPLPNVDPTQAGNNGNWNYVTNYSGNKPVYQELFRIDYAATDKLRMYVRAQWLENNNEGFGATANKMPTQFPYNYQTKSPNMVFNMTYTFSPTLLNELTLGTSEFDEFTPYNASDLPKVQKSASGYNYGQLYPANNPLNLFPAVSFGGTNAVSFGWDSRFPFYDITKQYSLTDSVTKILGRHNTKFGVDLKTDHYLQAHGSTGTPEGAFTFSSSSNMAADTYNGFANALLGNFQNYAEPNTRSDYNPRIYIVEGYGQDQWKVTPKLTLDYGTRFAWAKPPTLQTGGNFVPDLYVAANAPAMYKPCKGGSQTGVCDPTNGNFTANPTLSGLFVPSAVANPVQLTNGAITTTNHAGYPGGLVYGTGFQWAPRFGFAYDVFGDGKSAIRGGVGIFINPATQIGQEGDMTHNPPKEYTTTVYYDNIKNLQNAAGYQGPTGTFNAFQLHPKESRVYGFSLGVQRDIGFGTVLGVGYVGNVARNMTGQQNLNTVPYGAEFLQANQDPTKTSCAGKIVNVNCTPNPLPDNFFRKYQGYNTVNYRFTGLTSNYHSMQVTANRRFKGGLQFGVAYTWSRAMDYADSYDGGVASYQNLRAWNYGPAGFDVRNILVVNYLWSIPNGSRLWNNFATRTLLDGWQISGLASYTGGEPATTGYSAKYANSFSNATGGGDGARVVLTGDPMKKAPRKFGQWFDTSVFQAPTLSTLDNTKCGGTCPDLATALQTGALVLSNGVSPFAPVRLPGYTDFDTALFKNFKVENKFSVQLRLESYNTFNTPQFDAVNVGGSGFGTGPSFDATGAQTNASFGQISGSNGPRVLQLAGRISF